MSTAVLRPNGTISNTGPWTITGGVGTAWDVLDDAVTQPTAATTTDNVNTATAGRVLNLDLTASPSDVETVTAATIWIYASTAGNDRISVGLFQSNNSTQIGTTGLGSTNLTGSYAWYSFAITGLALTKTIIDGAILRLTSAANGAMSQVNCAAAYVELTYTPTPTWGSYTTGSYPDVVTTTSGLVAYWRLGESSGTAAADEGGRFAGTITGSPSLGAPSLLASDPANTAITFDGVNDIVTLGNASTFQLTTGTLKAWIKTSSATSGYFAIFIKRNAFGMFVKNGTLIVEDWGSGLDRDTGVNVNDGLPHQVGFSFQSGVASGTIVYVDGSPVLTTTMTVADQLQALVIGASENGIQWFPGVIDDPAIYNVVLSAGTMSADYTAGTAASSVSLAGTVTGSSTVAASGLLLPSQSLAGSVAGGSTVSAARLILPSQSLAGNVAGGSTVAAARLVVPFTLAGAIAGSSTGTAARLIVPFTLAGTVAGSSTVAASGLTLPAQSLAGAAAGASSVSAARLVLPNQSLAGSVAGGSTVAASRLIVPFSLAGAIAGGSTVSASTLDVAGTMHMLAGTITGGSTASASRLVLPGQSLAGAVAGSSSVAASQIVVPHLLAGSIDGETSVTGSNLSIIAILEGVVTASSSVTASGLIVIPPIDGTLTATVQLLPVLTASLTLESVLSANVQLLSVLSYTLTLEDALHANVTILPVVTSILELVP